MSGTGYTRQSTFTDGDIINASDSNDEFNKLLDVFSNTTGHKHDGSAAQGPVIGLIGDPGVATPINKVVVDDTNNRIGVFVDVSGSTTEQIRFQDGAIVPVTDNDIDLGTSSLEFKDLHLDGTANIDSLVADTADINGGTADNVVIGGSTAAAITGTTLVANTSLNIAGDGATVTGIKDEDDMSSDSATKLATQQSIKAYVDAQLTAEDLDFQADSGGALSIDLDSETLTFTGGTGIDTSGSSNTVTFAIDSTVATLTGSQTLTNKTLTTPVIAEIDSGADITLDATADIILDAGGANIIFKDDGTSILDIANNSSDVEFTVSTADKNFAIKGTDGSSAITALDIDMALNGQATFSGDVVVTGDLTVTGDDITMGTNTSGHIMVADGTNFNPVAVSGDVTISSAGAITIASGAVETAMLNANVISGQTAETSLDTSNDTVLIHDASASALKKTTLASISSALGGITDVVADTTPQLGGSLDVNGQDIVSVSNGNIDILPNGSGVVNLDGDGSSGGVSVSDGLIDIRTGTGNVSKVKFYCESSNAHAQTLQAQPHSAGSSAVLTLPVATGTLIGTGDTGSVSNAMLATINTAGKVALASLEIDGGTDIGADLADADLIIVDDGAGGTNRKAAMTRIATYVQSGISGDITISGGTAAIGSGVIVNADINASAAIADTKLATISTAGKVDLAALEIDGGTDIGADLTSSDLIIVDDGAGGTNRKAALSRLTTFMTSQGFSSEDPTALAIALG
jgi:hypothetical protein